MSKEGSQQQPLLFTRSGSTRAFLMIAAILILAVSVVTGGCSTQNQDSLEKVNSYADLHGLAVRPDGNLFITTHNGLFLLKDDTELYRIGKEKGDLMGFAMNPWNPDEIYASGHPANGGNIGVIASRDGGVTWRRIFKNIGSGAVDFHAMAISLADPNIIYGWYEDKLYRTNDSGHTWKFARAKGLSGVVSLATNPRNSETVYAGTVDGLFISVDKGETWSAMATLGFIGGIALDYRNPKVMYVFSEQNGMSRSADGGESWYPINNGLTLGQREIVMYVAIHPKDSKILYVGTTQNRILKTVNSGQSWKQIR